MFKDTVLTAQLTHSIFVTINQSVKYVWEINLVLLGSVQSTQMHCVNTIYKFEY